MPYGAHYGSKYSESVEAPMTVDASVSVTPDSSYIPPGPAVAHGSPTNPRGGLGYVAGPNRITREMARRKGRRRRVQS